MPIVENNNHHPIKKFFDESINTPSIDTFSSGGLISSEKYDIKEIWNNGMTEEETQRIVEKFYTGISTPGFTYKQLVEIFKKLEEGENEERS